MLIVASAAEPYLKPNLIDRFLISASKTGLRPMICINKIDLVDPASLAPLVGVYSQMGYQRAAAIVRNRFRHRSLAAQMAGRTSVVAGQSGVGSRLWSMRSIRPCGYASARVSAESQKGRHTTSTARLWPLVSGGYVVDTPGIRQFQLWDVIPAEIAGYYRDLRPYINHCNFPNCTHTHENGLRGQKRGRRWLAGPAAL